jgi:hypothetical protein
MVLGKGKSIIKEKRIFDNKISHDYIFPLKKIDK